MRKYQYKTLLYSVFKQNSIGVQSTMDFGEWGGATKFCDDSHFTRYSAHFNTKTKSHHLRYDSLSAKTNVTRVACVGALSAHIYTKTKLHHLQHESYATPQMSHELMLASLALDTNTHISMACFARAHFDNYPLIAPDKRRVRWGSACFARSAPDYIPSKSAEIRLSLHLFCCINHEI